MVWIGCWRQANFISLATSHHNTIITFDFISFTRSRVSTLFVQLQTFASAFGRIEAVGRDEGAAADSMGVGHLIMMMMKWPPALGPL